MMSVDEFAEISLFDDDEASLVASESSDCDFTDAAAAWPAPGTAASTAVVSTDAANVDEIAASDDFESERRDFDAWFKARAAAHAARLELAELELRRRLRANAAGATPVNANGAAGFCGRPPTITIDGTMRDCAQISHPPHVVALN